jgi:hypothetical protein
MFGIVSCCFEGWERGDEKWMDCGLNNGIRRETFSLANSHTTDQSLLGTRFKILHGHIFATLDHINYPFDFASC